MPTIRDAHARTSMELVVSDCDRARGALEPSPGIDSDPVRARMSSPGSSFTEIFGDVGAERTVAMGGDDGDDAAPGHDDERPSAKAARAARGSSSDMRPPLRGGPCTVSVTCTMAFGGVVDFVKVRSLGWRGHE